MFISNTSGATSYEVQRSVRLRSAASAYFSRVFSASDQTKWTFSAWVKRGTLGGTDTLLYASNDSTGNNWSALRFVSDQLEYFTIVGGSYTGRLLTTRLFRDPSAWYHITLVIDTNNATAADRQQLWVNGVRETSFSASTNHGAGNTTWVNGSLTHYINGNFLLSSFGDKYAAEINFSSGQALTPTSFAEQDTTTKMWVPKRYTGTYGTNGFYLDFSDITSTTTLGYDKSGNGNNWTANNISLTAGSTYDSMLDVPGLPWADGGNGRGNYATLNPLDKGTSVTVSEANLKWSVGGSSQGIRAGVYLPASGKFYWETVVTANGGNEFARIGVGGVDLSMNVSNDSATNVWYYAQNNGYKGNGGSAVAYGASYTTGDVIGTAVDMDSGKIWWSKNGVWQASGDPSSGANPAYSNIGTTQVSPYSFQVGLGITVATNFGQRPFAYTPPTGFKALHTGNLPTPTGAAAKPWEHFDVVLATGANIKTTAEGVFPSNYLEWIKDRANSNNHQLIDIVRGSSAVLQSNTTAAETTYSAPSGSSVGWVWKAGGAAVTNTAGSITSQVSANTAAGFSIVTYTGTGANATVGHGLGVAPKLIFVKRRNSTGEWLTYTQMTGNTNFLELNTTAASTASITAWSNTSPTSSVFSVGTTSGANSSNGTYVAYCFAEVPGFSKFGSYTGNGSADGRFVHCGFKPRYVLIKRTDSTGNWILLDGGREPENEVNLQLAANLSNLESTSTGGIDFASNGFKVRITSTDLNANGGTYIYVAFAESPFVWSNAR